MFKDKRMGLMFVSLALALGFQLDSFSQNLSPEETTKNFYSWYVKQESPTSTEVRKHITSRLYKKSYLSAQIRSFDYFTLDNQENPVVEFVKAVKITETRKNATVKVNLQSLYDANQWDEQVLVHLVKEKTGWKIDRVSTNTKKVTAEIRFDPGDFTKAPKDMFVLPQPLELAKPNYPLTPRGVQPVGEAKVEIVIDEDGKVISAKALYGHPLLREALKESALKSRFTPGTLSDQKVKFMARLIYFFDSK